MVVVVAEQVMCLTFEIKLDFDFLSTVHYACSHDPRNTHSLIQSLIIVTPSCHIRLTRAPSYVSCGIHAVSRVYVASMLKRRYTYYAQWIQNVKNLETELNGMESGLLFFLTLLFLRLQELRNQASQLGA